MSPQQILAAKTIGHAVLASIDELSQRGPVPEGTMYAALMHQGCSLNQFQSLMGGMERARLITREDDLVNITATGKLAIPRFAAEIAKLKKSLGVS